MDPLVVLLVILLLMSLQQRFIFLCLGLRCLSLRFLGRMGWMVRSHEAFLLPLIVMLLPDLFEDIPGLKMGERKKIGKMENVCLRIKIIYGLKCAFLQWMFISPKIVSLFSTQVHVTLMWLFVGAWARN
jgi:hypothetical protein